MSEQKFKEQKEEQDDFDAGFEIPDTRETKGKLEQAILYEQHQQQMQEEAEDEKQGKPQKKRQKPKGGTICVCGHPSCTIGGFVERQG